MLSLAAGTESSSQRANLRRISSNFPDSLKAKSPNIAKAVPHPPTITTTNIDIIRSLCVADTPALTLPYKGERLNLSEFFGKTIPYCLGTRLPTDKEKIKGPTFRGGRSAQGEESLRESEVGILEIDEYFLTRIAEQIYHMFTFSSR